jgi:hypothetical protein
MRRRCCERYPADILRVVFSDDQYAYHVADGLDRDGLSDRIVGPDCPDDRSHKSLRVRLPSKPSSELLSTSARLRGTGK